MSSDGSKVAIGATLNDNGNGVDAGHVRIYDYVNGNWTQAGDDIDGESEDDRSGGSVSMSSGFRLAIGQPTIMAMVINQVTFYSISTGLKYSNHKPKQICRQR